MTKYFAKWYNSIREIPNEVLLGFDINIVNPFFKLEWLKLLENSDSICFKTGWKPLHLVLWEADYPIGFAPLYLKSHSYGEFIFDHTFREVAYRLGLNYYPKLVGMSPLSPVEGYKFFTKKNLSTSKVTFLMLGIIDDFCRENKILSTNFLYVDKSWGMVVEEFGFLKWINEQSRWNANNDKTFASYLSNFNSNQRKNIRKERDSIYSKGINVSALTGKNINLSSIKYMHDFYSNHCSKYGMWSSKYLSESFFINLLDKEIKNNIVLFKACLENNEKPLAMSMCLKNKDMLWGRYWGSQEDIEFLHFELCYYAPINWSLENKIKYFDPGAGGAHKKRRGFISIPSVSLVKWQNQNFHNIIKSWLLESNTVMLHKINETNAALPFRVDITTE
tara:strand:+ start:335 stop:1507 length:1173 start_codon:yes stop_codon:yes gene_type:complete